MDNRTGKRAVPSLFLGVLFLNSAFNVQAAWLDAPHTGGNGVGCVSCHQMTSTYPKLLPPLDHSIQDIDDNAPEAGYTTVSQRTLFIERTGVSCFAGCP